MMHHYSLHTQMRMPHKVASKTKPTILKHSSHQYMHYSNLLLVGQQVEPN